MRKSLHHGQVPGRKPIGYCKENVIVPRIITDCIPAKLMIPDGNYKPSPKREFKGPGKRGHIVGDTLSPTEMFPSLPARTTFVGDTNLLSGIQ